MGRVFFVWGLMGIKRRRRETAIAEGKKPLTTRGSSGSRTSQTGGQILAGIFERLFLRVSRQNFSIFSQKNFVPPCEFWVDNSFFFRVWGGFTPPSPYVEPPLLYAGIFHRGIDSSS